MKRYLVPVILIAIILLCGCGGSPEATPAPTDEPTGTPTGPDRPAAVGDTVSVDYTGTLEDGTQFDSSIGREPLQFTIGSGQMIPGFEQAMIGMKLGEVKTVVIPSDEAYGPYRVDIIEVLPIDLLQDVGHEVGMKFYMQTVDGRTIECTVIDVSEDNVTVYKNHPLAGKDLTFEILLLEIL